ncbi:MAG: outer membrane lipoprotein-sorting protein [Candidatus Brocadiia bacterium]
MRHTRRAVALLALLAAPALARAGEAVPPVEEIVKKAERVAYYQGDDGRSDVKMTIVDAQGRTREREFVILRKDVRDGGDQKFYVYFHSPADVRRTIYRVWKHVGEEDERWLYTPGLDLVRQIAPSDKRTSFVGSHFYYEDVSGRSVADDTHELVQTTDQHFVVRNVPKKPRLVEFASYTVWIDRKTFMPMKAEYIHKDDNSKYRVVEALEVKEIQGFPTVTRSRVRDLKSGGHTISEFSEIEYDIGLPDSLFGTRYERRPPRRYLD